MRIYDRDATSAAAAEAGQARETQRIEREGRLGSASPAAGETGDRVEFSTGLGQLSNAMTSWNADRADRIQALAAQYQEGRYSIDSMALSRAMVTEALSPGTE